MKLSTTLAVAIMICLPGIGITEGLTPQQILEKNYLANRLMDSKAEITMLLKNDRGNERKRLLAIYTKRINDGPDNKYALFFRSPADIKGTATLLVQVAGSDDDMWVYLPALRKTRRLYSDNKRDSFFGSELSYGDIIGHRPDDWTARFLGKDVIDSREVIVLEALPASDSVMEESGYSKRVLYVDQESYLAIKTEYWDDIGEPLKEIIISDIKRLNTEGKYQFMKISSQNFQSKNATEISYELFEYDIGLSDDLFSERALKKGLGLR